MFFPSSCKFGNCRASSEAGLQWLWRRSSSTTAQPVSRANMEAVGDRQARPPTTKRNDSDVYPFEACNSRPPFTRNGCVVCSDRIALRGRAPQRLQQQQRRVEHGLGCRCSARPGSDVCRFAFGSVTPIGRPGSGRRLLVQWAEPHHRADSRDAWRLSDLLCLPGKRHAWAVYRWLYA